MKTKQEIKQEIFDLAQKISVASSDKLVLETTRELYEKAILLKYAVDSVPQAIVEQAEKIVEIIKDPVQTEAQSIIVEKKQAPVDLFSTDAPVEEIIPVPAPAAKPAPKEQKAPKKKATESVAEKLQHKKITDLKASIGINEKFQFINELFEGNMKEYNVAIDQINSFSSLEEAESYISNLEDVYKWQPENQIVENFKLLVQRRFA